MFVEFPTQCESCHKPVTELKPFGGPGDPLVGDFTGLKLVSTFRALYEGPPIEEYEKILNEYKHNEETRDDNIPFLEEKYGKEKVQSAFDYSQLQSTVGRVLLCRDCILKDDIWAK